MHDFDSEFERMRGSHKRMMRVVIAFQIIALAAIVGLTIWSLRNPAAIGNWIGTLVHGALAAN